MWLQHRRRGSYRGGGRQFSWQAHLCILWNVTAKTCPWGKGVLYLSLLSLMSASAISWHLCANDFILNLFSGQAQNSHPTNYILFYRIMIITAEAVLQVVSRVKGSLLERMCGRNAPIAKYREDYFDNSHGNLKSKHNPKEQMRINSPMHCVLYSRAKLSVNVYLNSISTKNGVLLFLNESNEFCLWYDYSLLTNFPMFLDTNNDCKFLCLIFRL